VTDPAFVVAADLAHLGPGASPPEPTAAAVDDVVYYTASRVHAVSTDGGETFGAWAYTGTVFGGSDGTLRTPIGDESAIYAPLVDRFIWAMLYREPGSGRNVLRLAFTGTNEVASGATSWAYLDLDADGLARPGYSFDYPQLAVTLAHLYVTANLFNGSDRTQIALRLPLGAFRPLEPHQVGFEYFLDDSDWFFGPVQSCTSRFLCVQHISLDTVRLWSWEESASAAIAADDVSVPPWSDGDYSSLTPDGKDWLDHCGARAVGAQVGDDVVIAWSAGRDSAGGHRRPHPYIYFAHMAPDGDGFALAGTRTMWNPAFAFAVPSVAVLGGRAAFNCGYGGGSTHYPTPLMGFLELPFAP